MSQKTSTVLLVLALAIGAWLLYTRPNPDGTALRIRELAARGLAGEIARSQPAGPVLVLSNPFVQQPGVRRDIAEVETAGLAGLRAGLGTKHSVEAVVPPELLPAAKDNPWTLLEGNDSTTPISFLMAPDAVDKLVKQHPNCGVIVSLVGLPAELDRCQAWKSPGAPWFAFLLPDFRGIADRATILEAFKSGKLLAAVLPKPGAPGNDGKMSGDFEAEFEKRFLLVTPENAARVLEQMPALF